MECIAGGHNAIIWGGNYFPLPPSRCWIIWDKIQPVPNFSDGEMAWTSFDKVVSFFRFSFAANVDKIHITQKPLKLYKWLLENYAQKGDKIFDSHMGSGSSAIACYQMGFSFVGCEIDVEYYKAAEKRFEQETKQVDMF